MATQNILGILFFLLFFTINTSRAQTFEVEADARARFEYRHGFNNLFPDNAKPAALVVQRTRLNIGYSAKKLQFFMAIQDVGIWGDTRQLLPNDGNDSFSLYEGWTQLHFNENWSTRLGRQAIAYDNQRIFGSFDGAMQGRFHDAAIIKYKKNDFVLDFGGAFSQDQARNEGTVFNIRGAFTYKSMQYAYLKKTWKKSSASFLFLNTGFQNFTGEDNTTPNGVSYRQTTGSYFKFPIQDVQMVGSVYYQSGKADPTTNIGAYQISLEGTTSIDETIKCGLGFELLSGTDQDGDSKNRSFFPLYGSNHRFNGFMDYFYVRNHANDVGLNTVFAKTIITTGKKSNLLFKGHYFAANANLTENTSKYLGTEIDLMYSHKLMPSVKLLVGYSHMFASKSMSLVKGGRPNDNTNNLGWVQLIVKPKLFKADLGKLTK